MSTGYMSGEAYELPEAREPLMEPTLASVEEISGSLRSEDLFTLTHSQVRKNLFTLTHSQVRKKLKGAVFFRRLLCQKEERAVKLEMI